MEAIIWIVGYFAAATIVARMIRNTILNFHYKNALAGMEASIERMKKIYSEWKVPGTYDHKYVNGLIESKKSRALDKAQDKSDIDIQFGVGFGFVFWPVGLVVLTLWYGIELAAYLRNTFGWSFLPASKAEREAHQEKVVNNTKHQQIEKLNESIATAKKLELTETVKLLEDVKKNLT